MCIAVRKLERGHEAGKEKRLRGLRERTVECMWGERSTGGRAGVG